MEVCIDKAVAEMHSRGDIISNLTSRLQNATRQLHDSEQSSQTLDTFAGLLYLLLILGSILMVVQPLLNRACNPPWPLQPPSTQLSHRPPPSHPPSTPFPNPPPLPPAQPMGMSPSTMRMFRKDIADDMRNVVENALDERDDPTFREGYQENGNEADDYRTFKDEYRELEERYPASRFDSESEPQSESESESLCSGDRSVLGSQDQQRVAEKEALRDGDADAAPAADAHNPSFIDFDYQQEVARRALQDVDATADANADIDIDFDHRSGVFDRLECYYA